LTESHRTIIRLEMGKKKIFADYHWHRTTTNWELSSNDIERSRKVISRISQMLSWTAV